MATVINFSIGVGVFIALQHAQRFVLKAYTTTFISQKKSLFFRQEFEENNIYESGIYKHKTLN